MNDGRSTRKAKVLPFISRIERDRSANLQSLVEKAKLMKLEGFDSINWEESSWSITGGRLIKLTGKNTNASKFNFLYSPQLGEQPLPPNWDHAAKALFVLRFHRKHQAAPNQRNFITSVGYVAFVATELGLDLFRLTPEALDKACRLASQHYSEGVAYNIHKHIAEFAAHCDANGLCKVLLQYKYAKMKRPTSTGGINHTRLDDPSVLETKSDKLITPAVFKVIGELYQTVPKDHKYRFYILILSLLCCTGRRFSEISLIPNQKLSFDTEGKAFLTYFPRKASKGDTFTPKRKLYLPSDTITIVQDILNELVHLTQSARETAAEMQRNSGADLRFLNIFKASNAFTEKIYKM